MKTEIYRLIIKPFSESEAAEKAMQEYSEQLNKACEIEQVFYRKFGSFMPDDLFEQIVEIITK